MIVRVTPFSSRAVMVAAVGTLPRISSVPLTGAGGGVTGGVCCCCCCCGWGCGAGRCWPARGSLGVATGPADGTDTTGESIFVTGPGPGPGSAGVAGLCGACGSGGVGSGSSPPPLSSIASATIATTATPPMAAQRPRVDGDAGSRAVGAGSRSGNVRRGAVLGCAGRWVVLVGVTGAAVALTGGFVVRDAFRDAAPGAATGSLTVTEHTAD